MFYLTMPQTERYRDPTFDDFLAGKTTKWDLSTWDASGSITTSVPLWESFPEKIKFQFANEMETHKAALIAWHAMTEAMVFPDGKPSVSNWNAAIHDQYSFFHIAKKSGGLRRISAPCDELKTAQRELAQILERATLRAYHTNAFAYIHQRSTWDAVHRHQKWGSNWFAHYDFSDFFGSTTQSFVLAQLAKQMPFCMWRQDEEMWSLLSRALDYGFLDGGLPQGTPLSPMLTNLMMIPFDYKVTQAMRNLPSSASKNGTDRFVYTRYADDIDVSCRVFFKVKEIERFLEQILREEHAPFKIKSEKTQFGNRAGANWMLGLVLNASNEISIGWKKKKTIKAMLHAFACDHKKGVLWNKNDLQIIQGHFTYWKHYEPGNAEHAIEVANQKHGFDILRAIRSDMKIAG